MDLQIMVLADKLHKLPGEIWGMPCADAVMAMQYYTFLSDYEETAAEINREAKK